MKASIWANIYRSTYLDEKKMNEMHNLRKSSDRSGLWIWLLFQSPVGKFEVLLVLGMVSDKAEWHSNRERAYHGTDTHMHVASSVRPGEAAALRLRARASERGLSYEPNPSVGGEDAAISHIGWWRLCGTRCLKKEQRKRIVNIIPCSVCLSTFRYPRRLGYFCFSIQDNS